MLHVKIDLVPFGREENRKQISECFIANVGAYVGLLTKYHCWKTDPRFPANKEEPKVVFHNRAHGCEPLVAQALKDLK